MFQLFMTGSYELTALAVTFLVASLLILQFVLLLFNYHRQSKPALVFLVGGLFLSGYLASDAMAFMAVDARTARGWVQLSSAANALLTPSIYGLVVTLAGTQVRRRGVLLVISTISVLFAALSLAGVSWTAAPRGAEGLPLVRFFQLFQAVVMAATIGELLRANGRSPNAGFRRKLSWVLAGFAVGSVALLGYSPSTGTHSPVYILPTLIGFSIIGFAAVRVRAFELTPAYAADTIIATMDELVLVCDADAVVRVANGASLSLLGCPPAKLIGQPLAALLMEEEAAAALATARGVTAPRMLEFRCRSGPPVPVSVSVRAMTDADGEGIGFVLVARDERERRAAQEELRASERRYRWLFESSPAAKATLDDAGRFVDVNPACARLAGASIADLIGRRFTEFVVEEGRQEAERLFGLAAGGKAADFEMRIRALDGRRLIVRAMVVRLPRADAGSVIMAMALDVTAERRAQQELARQKRHFEMLLQDSPAAIVLVTLEGEVLEVNDEFVRLFGYTAAEAVGRNLDELITGPGALGEAIALTRNAAEGRRAWAEAVRHRKDGSLVDVAILARKIQREGEPPLLYGIYNDISERKQMEAALRSREEQVQRAQRLAAVAQLAGGVAHDFNNLLTVIEVRTQLMLDRLSEHDPLSQELADIRQVTKRAAELVRKLLALSQQYLMRPVLLDLNEVVQRQELALRAQLPNGIRLQVDYAGAAAWVRVDLHVIEQSLTELVANAVRAMPDGGVINVTLGMHNDGATTSCHLTVSDTGLGMEQETLARVFEPFFSTQHRTAAHGLGLATVHGLVAQSGGEIRAESAPGIGSAFTIVLPAAQPQIDAAPAPMRALPTGPITILLADDEPMVRLVVRRALERRGYRVLETVDGVEALQLLDRLAVHPQLLLTDLVMPRLGGHELVARVRARLPDVRVIAMSGYDETFASQPEQEWDAFLAKPFTVDQLIDAVQHALSLPDGEIPALLTKQSAVH